MARTLLTTKEIGSVQLNDFDITTSGQAVITKVTAGTNITLSSTGVDAGTGNVTINASASAPSDITALSNATANSSYPAGGYSFNATTALGYPVDGSLTGKRNGTTNVQRLQDTLSAKTQARYWIDGSTVWSAWYPYLDTATDLTAGSVAFGVSGGLIGEDNANLFWDDTNNRLGIGTASPSYQFHVKDTAAIAEFHFNQGGIEIVRYGANTYSAPSANFYRARGTLASPTGTSASDQCGDTYFYAHDGTSFKIAAGFGAIIRNSTAGAGIIFRTASVGTVSNPSDRFEITETGNIVIGTAALATSATDGFVYLTTMAGIPSGTPTSVTGRAPIIIDSTNNRFLTYINSVWTVIGQGDAIALSSSTVNSSYPTGAYSFNVLTSNGYLVDGSLTGKRNGTLHVQRLQSWATSLTYSRYWNDTLSSWTDWEPYTDAGLNYAMSSGLVI